METQQEIIVTGFGKKVIVPAWAKLFPVRAVSLKDAAAMPTLPEVTVLQADEPRTIFSNRSELHRLAVRQGSHKSQGVIVLAFARTKRASQQEMIRLLEEFPQGTVVELAFGADRASDALAGAVAKAHVLRKREKEGARDPLGQVRSIVDATVDLHAENGRLHAGKVANVFGLKDSEMAKALHISRQALFKTPDSRKIQKTLRDFERTARLRAVFKDDVKFRAWLRMPLDSLEKEAPLDLLLNDEHRTVGDLAEDMLTGAPT